MRSGLLLLFVISLVGCSRMSNRNVRNTNQRARAKATPTAVAIAMDRQVKNAIDVGEGDPFVRYLRQKISADPDNSGARFELADQYQKQGAYELAAEHLRIAVDRQPDSEFAVRKLATALRASEQDLDAITVMVRFCENHPKASVLLLEEVAMAQDESGALGEGERYHRRAIAIDDHDDTLRNNLGYNFLQQKKYEDAAHEFKAALQLNPRSEAARNNLGFALARLEQPKEALLHWSSISGPAAAHNNLAAVLIDEGRLPEARKEIQAALDFDRHNSAAVQNLQLLSELDGKPASFTIKSIDRAAQARGWARVPAALSKFFRGDSPRSSKETASQNSTTIASEKTEKPR